MYLSRLEILGFKSFAQKTNVQFNEGVTSIVGPNGCGKTNIVDAIRWCLGEQRSGTLRSDKMENVIFNGTSNKKPMGMAEVSLTIENNKGILPTEYSEVTITRRIFRSGESEYLLNKNICRLKDITNLFMDTGIGANAYSVIELKMVETILSNKAEERRTMFEEAAGVNKYKLRRRLALKKLDDVKSDLNRVNDIVTEVEKKVNSLERQAKKAEKSNKISSIIRDLEIDISEREYARFSYQKEENKNIRESNFKEKLLIESNISEIDSEIKSVKEKLNEIEKELKLKRSELTIQTEKIYDSQNYISVNKEREKSLESNINRYSLELDELKIELENSRQLIIENKEIISGIYLKIEDKESVKKSYEDKVIQFRAYLEEKRKALKLNSDMLLERFKEITTKENEFSNLEIALDSRNNSISRLNEKIQLLTGNIAKTVGFIEELEEDRTETGGKIAEAENIYSTKQQEKENFEKELNLLKEKELEERSFISSLKDKITFIQNLIDNLEGVSKGAKALLENNGWMAGNKTLLANIGNTSEEYRFAIEASLKNNLNNIIVESIVDLKNGIEYLRKSENGKASFFVTQTQNDKSSNWIQYLQSYFIRRKISLLKKEKGFLGFAQEFIQTEEKWIKFFEKLLSKTVLVDSLETAFSLSAKYNMFNFVTMNGDYIDQSGIIEGGSAPRLDDSLFGRKQLLENLKNEFPRKEIELEKLHLTIEEKEHRITNIDLKQLSEKGRMLVNDLANIEKQIAQFKFEKQKAVDEIEKARTELQELASDYNRLDNEKSRVYDSLSVHKVEKLMADEESNRMDEDFKNTEQEFTALNSGLNTLNLELERLYGDLRNSENEIKRAEESVDSIIKNQAKRELDISSTMQEKNTINSILEEKLIEFDELTEFKNLLLRKENEIDSEFKSIRSVIEELEVKQDSFRKIRESVSDNIHHAEIKLNELNLMIKNLLESIKENYSLTLELKQFQDNETFEFEKKTEELHSLKQQIRNLGPINLLAYSEYEEEKERFDFLNKQRNDLLESEKDIVKTIGEINSTAQSLFIDTFEKIRGHFINIFRGLFNPGDEADLKLEENIDPLEAKIEIIAKPKGKRPTSIELLSGGEKTLTAIALLFAIYLVKPSPFCILDEIDAPLDDANIDRFTKIIKDFSNDTQFIVVTHNKRTMEAADTLYGVTMQEEGVSKLVSVRFNEDFNFVN
ncbi:MAG: chromosome segregation protein SMC [Ignavibacteriaceae bacterium]|nr:chromosome segregation protein SMC [Ignavibacteriaceae bacterium]